MTTSVGFGPSSGTMSAQSGGLSPLICITVSEMGCRDVPAVPSTWMRKTGIPFLLKASASLAALEMTVVASWGRASTEAIPFCRSITTRAVFVRSTLSSLTGTVLAWLALAVRETRRRHDGHTKASFMS